MTTIKEARSETEAPKKRGRPKGSKNKAETTKTTETHTPGRKKGFRFERDADGNLLKKDGTVAKKPGRKSAATKKTIKKAATKRSPGRPKKTTTNTVTKTPTNTNKATTLLKELADLEKRRVQIMKEVAKLK
jgi:hypothetical protein